MKIKEIVSFEIIIKHSSLLMKYIIKGADKLVGEGRTFNDRAIVLFSILILVSLTCRGFLKNFTLGIVFLIVSIAFLADSSET